MIYRVVISGLVLVLCCTALVSAAAVGSSLDKDTEVARARSRSATADILYRNPLPISNWRNALLQDPQTDVTGRSVPLAFGLSAVIPGLGQAYNRDWLAAALFVAVEVALVASHYSWKNSGNQGVEEYEQFANQNWSPIQYAEWLNDFKGYGGPDVELPSLTEQDFQRPEDWSVAQRAEVDGFFRDIRTAERLSTWPTTGASFSHVLPFFGEQQYYELIGKYFQYSPAWTDYTGSPDDDPVDVLPEDANFYFYADIHAAAQGDLRKSSVASSLLIMNHFAAAAQSAIMARIHNKRIQPSVSLSQGPRGDLVTTARLVLTF